MKPFAPTTAHCSMENVYAILVFTKSVDSNFRAFWLAPVTRNILGYSLFCERREKWRVVSRKFQKKLWPFMKRHFFYPSHLVNTKTTNPLRVGEERWIYTSTLASPSGHNCILILKMESCKIQKAHEFARYVTIYSHGGALTSWLFQFSS